MILVALLALSALVLAVVTLARLANLEAQASEQQRTLQRLEDRLHELDRQVMAAGRTGTSTRDVTAPATGRAAASDGRPRPAPDTAGAAREAASASPPVSPDVAPPPPVHGVSPVEQERVPPLAERPQPPPVVPEPVRARPSPPAALGPTSEQPPIAAASREDTRPPATPPAADVSGTQAPARDYRPPHVQQRPTTFEDLRESSGGGRPAPGEPRSFDWENLVGVTLFSWIAAIALALAGVFFLRYSIQQGWLQPPVQMAIGLFVGLAVLTGCEMKVARNYPVTANALDAAGIVILFSTFFAAFALWHLLGAGAAFFFLILVTTVAVLLSIRRDSLFIAILGLVGGFLTPAVLSTGQDNPIGLFGYLLMLNAGLAWVACRKRWALLAPASLVLTTAYQWSWVAKFLTEAKLPLAAGIFLVFPIVGIVALAFGRRGSDDSGETTFTAAAFAGALLPLLFAAYLASIPAYGAHTGLVFGFLFCIDLGLLVVAARLEPPSTRRRPGDAIDRLQSDAGWLHVAGGIATNIVLLCYVSESYSTAAWPAVLGFVSLFVLFYLVSPLIARAVGWPLEGFGRHATYTGSVLLFAFPALVGLESRTAAAGPVFGVLFALLATASAVALAERQGAVHFVAAFFALVAEAVWSARFLTDARLLSALVVYLVFALFYIGVPVAARRLGRPLQPPEAGGAILIVSLCLLFFPAGVVATDSALWGLSLLLAILNVATFVEGVSVRRPLLALVSTFMSWWVICAWWSRATAGSLTGPGLLVVAGFTVLTLGGHAWNARRSDRDDAAAQNGIYLGLVGHLFLLYVAAQPGLSIPPWPMFAVLLLLDLAAGVTVLYMRQAGVHLAAIVASALVLIAWQSHAVQSPWPSIAILCAAGLAAFAVVWMGLARRADRDERFLLMVDAAAPLAFLLALVVSIFAVGVAGGPSAAFVTVSQMTLVAGLLAVAARRRWYFLAVVAVLPYAATVASWHGAHPDAAFWFPLLAISAGVYAVFLAYPILVSRRLGPVIDAHLAAVLASAMFFFAGRHSLLAGGYADIIGILPVAQAALMTLLLVDLLRLEPPGARTTGRLALVAGTALAFITVAIPLQLEKEWITIGWALEGAALAWLYRRIPHRGLLVASTALLAAVFVRLALNPAVFVYQPRGAYRIWNWYLYTYCISATALLGAARLFRTTDDALVRGGGRFLHVRSLAAAGGTILLFLLLNIEIADFYSVGSSITFNFAGTLAQDMTYTLGWGTFAVMLLIAGIAIESRPARFAALMLLVATVLKGFLHDLARLGGLYRVASFVGLAVCLALVALMLQKFVLRPRSREAVRSRIGN